ncbi:MAG: UvrB/UvrC motif-containing protein [Candidatus Omnitrophota bacterium]
MLCDICSKNQATVHLTEIVDEQMTELHLCEECAKHKSIQMEQQFGLSDLLGGLVDFGKNFEGKENAKVKCPSCNLSYEDFKKVGRLGCSNCYVSFIKFLTPLLKRIHGSSIHIGKVPRYLASAEMITKREPKKPKIELQDLKLKLQETIRSENFEEAARLRDQIRALEEQSLASDKPKASLKGTGRKKRESS